MWVKPGKLLCVKTMSRQLEVCEGEQLQGGHEISVRGCSANSWSQENVCVGDEQQNREVPKIGESVKVFPAIVNSTVGGVCMWVRTDSPATPLPKIITASTTSSISSMKVVG